MQQEHEAVSFHSVNYCASAGNPFSPLLSDQPPLTFPQLPYQQISFFYAKTKARCHQTWSSGQMQPEVGALPLKAVFRGAEELGRPGLRPS